MQKIVENYMAKNFVVKVNHIGILSVFGKFLPF